MPEDQGSHIPEEVTFPDLTFRETQDRSPEELTDPDASELTEHINGLEQRIAGEDEIEAGMAEVLVRDENDPRASFKKAMKPGVVRNMTRHNDEDGTDTTELEHMAKEPIDGVYGGIYYGKTTLSYVKDALGVLTEVTGRVSRPTPFRARQPQRYATWSAGEGFRGAESAPGSSNDMTAEQAREFLGSIIGGFNGLLTEVNR